MRAAKAAHVQLLEESVAQRKGEMPLSILPTRDAALSMAVIVLPCADDVNQQALVRIPTHLLPPKRDYCVHQPEGEVHCAPTEVEKKEVFPPAALSRLGGSAGSATSCRPRRERYYRQDFLPTAASVQKKLAATPTSPKPFQRRHLTGIPDAFEADPRHKKLLSDIAVDVAFTTEKRRTEKVLQQRAEYAVRAAKRQHPHQSPESRLTARSTREIAKKSAEEWESVALARCVNAQSRYILMATTLRERATMEQLECESNTMLEDIAYLKKQLESVDFIKQDVM